VQSSKARSHDDLTNTRDRPAFSRAFRGSVQAEIIDNREGKQRQRKPVNCRLPFVLEKFVVVQFFALSPTFVIGERGGLFWFRRAGMRLRPRWIWAGSARRARHCHFE
jgi:hypothetical protein